jgi:2-methylcitrate dehydratase PrpD
VLLCGLGLACTARSGGVLERRTSSTSSSVGLVRASSAGERAAERVASGEPGVPMALAAIDFG